jgi:[1-hydroxy-2-(trimethylamino)ethyl]phosphonate dioxygenase
VRLAPDDFFNQPDAAQSSDAGLRRIDERGNVEKQMAGDHVMSRVDDIFAIYNVKGRSAYGGERVNQLEHALQTAQMAEQSGVEASLIVASLLHDCGHLIYDFGEDVFRRGIDDRHEILGADKLSAFFGDAVTTPIRLHVDAKRYLCATDPEYVKLLSPASSRSLYLQGGPFSAAESDAFIKRPFATDAARLRRWDESAKRYGLQTPNLEHFRPYLEACLIG